MLNRPRRFRPTKTPSQPQGFFSASTEETELTSHLGKRTTASGELRLNWELSLERWMSAFKTKAGPSPASNDASSRSTTGTNFLVPAYFEDLLASLNSVHDPKSFVRHSISSGKFRLTDRNPASLHDSNADF
ncbi:hypothetical protein EBX31_02785 [bacterium]|nr:hypothetical protein [bacterium]